VCFVLLKRVEYLRGFARKRRNRITRFTSVENTEISGHYDKIVRDMSILCVCQRHWRTRDTVVLSIIECL